MWIEWIKGFDQWKPGDRSNPAERKAQAWINAGLAKPCDAPRDTKAPVVEVADAAKPAQAERAELTPETPLRRRVRPPKGGGN